VSQTSHLKTLKPEEMNPPLNPTLVVDGAGLQKLQGFFERVSEFGTDTETNIVDFYQDRVIRTVQFGDRNEQYVVDLLAFADGNTQKLIHSQGHQGLGVLDCLRPVIDIIRKPLESRSHLKIGQNLAFEYIVWKWCLGIRSFNFYGIDIAEKLLLAGLVPPFAKGHFAMDDMVKKYLWLIIDKTLQKSFDLENPLTQNQVVYAALDTRLPIGVRTAQLPWLRKDGLETVTKIENDAVGAFEDMHMNGFYLNGSAWMELIEKTKIEHVKNIAALDTHFIPIVGIKGQLDLDLDRLEEEWKNTPNKTPEEKAQRAVKRQEFMAARSKQKANEKKLPSYEGEASINYGSPDQLLDALHRVKGLNKTTLPDTNDDTLKKKADEFEILAALRDYRTTQKKLSTYGEEWLQWINPKTGRVHSRFNQQGTDTGRPSSAKPNLYNLPKEPEVRACWQSQPPKEGEKKKGILKNDMSGAELRLLAELSLAKSWIEAFEKDWDIHSVATEILYPDKWPTLGLQDCAYFNKDHKKCKCPAHNELRDGTKATHFLIINGGGPRKLSTDLGCEYEVAMALMNNHQKTFGDIWGFLNHCGKFAAMNMEAVRSVAGRRRQFVRPTWEQAQMKVLEEKTKKKDTRLPTGDEVRKKMRGLFGNIERQGKNTPLQSSNADIAKLAMGSGFDNDGKPFLWHILEPEHHAMFVNFVYDEFVIEGDADILEPLALVVSDAIFRAGKMLLKHVEMKSEWKIGEVWTK
jgi:DNA polymerase I-like protein with 3'-5' exonuclease and polymerase domains